MNILFDAVLQSEPFEFRRHQFITCLNTEKVNTDASMPTTYHMWFWFFIVGLYIEFPRAFDIFTKLSKFG